MPRKSSVQRPDYTKTRAPFQASHVVMYPGNILGLIRANNGHTTSLAFDVILLRN